MANPSQDPKKTDAVPLTLDLSRVPNPCNCHDCYYLPTPGPKHDAVDEEADKEYRQRINHSALRFLEDLHQRKGLSPPTLRDYYAFYPRALDSET